MSMSGKKKQKRRRLNLWGCIAFLILTAAAAVPQITNRGPFSTEGQKQIGYSSSLVEEAPDQIPDYSGCDYVILENNVPNFSRDDVQSFQGEAYSRLDFLGRCGPAMALIDRTMMPTEERENIGDIRPSGWVQAKYEGIVDSTPPYLYNRCHLIAYGLTGQNANELNLITGTRYFNAEAMLPFEVEVMKYLDCSVNHVLYRVTPYFKEMELVARGVEIEAYSVEDGGTGVCFHVFVYNQQPGIVIDYNSGSSRIA